MSQVSPGPGPNKPPVLYLIVEAWRLAFARLGDLAFLAAAPALALCGLSALRTIAAGPEPSAIWVIAEQLMWAFIWASLGVSWHRFVLLGERNKATWGELPFGPREATFFLYALALRAPGVAVVLLMDGEGPEQFGSLILLCGALQVLVTVMFPFVLPGAAVDRNVGFMGAWTLLRGSALRVFVAALLAAFPALAVMIVLAPIAGLGGAGPVGILFSPFEVLPSLVAEGVVAIVVALAYRQLAGMGRAPGRTT